MSYGVTYCWRWCQGQIDDAKWFTKATGSLLRYQLTNACNFKCSTFNRFCYNVKWFPTNCFKCMFYNAWARYTYGNSAITFGYTEESTRHKWIIFYRITKNNKFSTTKCIIIFSKVSCLFNDNTHFTYGVHVDTCFRRTNTNRTTNDICCS